MIRPLDVSYLLNASSRLALMIALFTVVACVFTPFSPKMPASGLDPSWATGLNQAVALGLNFGKQVIFTLGPYAAIYTKVYHPKTDAMMIWGSLYLAINYWLCLTLLLRGERWWWALPFTIVLLCLMYSRDSLLLSYPLLLGLVCDKQLCNDDSKAHFDSSYWIIGILFTPLGLLPLIKGSLLLYSAATIVLCFINYLRFDRKKSAVICLLIPILSSSIFWLISGQCLLYLPAYFLNSTLLAINFSQAMADHAPSSEIILYLLASLSLLIAIYHQKSSINRSKLFLFSISFCFLFISFKAGFTRHQGHVYIPGTSLFFASILLAMTIKNKWLIPIFIFAFTCGIIINKHYTHISLKHNFLSRYQASYHGVKDRLFDPEKLAYNYTTIMHYLAEESNIPKMFGSSDIYSYNQTPLIASGNQWAPRPIMQSYSGFGASELRKNANYLSKKAAPRNILFQLAPIDGRLPALEDGTSWPQLLGHYNYKKMQNNFLFLQKNGSTFSFDFSKQKVITHNYQLGDRITPPVNEELLFVSIEIQNTLWGKLSQFLYKSSPLYIHLWLNDGSERHYRFIASMAGAGFLLSPLIEKTVEFAHLYKNRIILKHKRVKAFTIDTQGNNNHQWQDSYVIKWLKVSAI